MKVCVKDQQVIAKNEKYKIITAVRDQAQNTHNRPQQILGNALQGVDYAVAANFPLVGTMRRNIRRQWRGAENALPVPATRAALPHPIPLAYSTTKAGDLFLR